MATTVLGNTPTTIDDAESATGWTLLTTLDTDLVKENANSVSGTMRTALAMGYYDIITDGGSALNLASQHVRVWINFSTVAFLDIEANGGMEFYMYDGSTTEYFVAFGSDTYSGGWKNFVVDADLFTTLTLSAIQRWGFRFNRTAAPANKINTWVDYIRFGDGYYATGGTSGDEITLSSMFALDFAGGYGILDLVEGVYFGYGELQIGNGSTTTWWEMLGEVLVFTDQPIATGLYTLRGQGSGCRVVIADSVIQAAGTTDTTRFILDMDDADLVSFSMTGSFLKRSGECRFKSGQIVTGNTFNDCGQIFANGADLSGSKVAGYEGTTDTGALSWTPATDPNGELDDMSFTKGSAATHAIEFGIASPTTMTLTGIAFSGYNAADGQTDSALLIRRTTGTVDIALVGCTGTIKYKSLGATVTLTASKSATFTPIENGSAFTITKDSDNSILLDVPSTTGGEVVYSYDGALDGTATTVHIIIVGKEPIDFAWVIAEGTVPITQGVDRNYSNPT